MKKITMYSTAICPYCVQAERLLVSKGHKVEKIGIDVSDKLREEMIRLTGKRTVPQIYIGDHYVGGYDQLASLEKQGQLDALLTAS
jgi:glutaredoxin 3